MSFRIEYFNERVEATIADWPEDILADYARLIKLLADHGPDLRMPHSRAFGDGLFELRAKSASGIVRPIGNRRLDPFIEILNSKRHRATLSNSITFGKWSRRAGRFDCGGHGGNTQAGRGQSGCRWGPVRIGAVVDKLAVNADDTVALAEVVQVLLRGGRV